MRNLLAIALLLLGVAGPALADDDHERARAALERGEVLPLMTILERLAPVIDGDIVETELDREDGRWIYEITYIDRTGRLIELEIDAADGTVLNEKRKR
jgi:uncharacterized membrane protein YkoI